MNASHSKMAAAALALTLFAALTAAQGQSNGPASEELAEADRLSAEVVRLFGQGRHDEAAPMAAEALMCTAATAGGYRTQKKVWDRLDEILKDADPVRGVVLDGKVVLKPQPEYPAAAK